MLSAVGLALTFPVVESLGAVLVLVCPFSYINENAPPGLSATTQGVFGAAVFGFGAAVGGLVGGILLERVGGASMFTFFGSLTFFMLIVYILLERHLPHPQPAVI